MSNKTDMFQIDDQNLHFRANIKVVGIGGGGGNAIKTMYQSGLSGVEFIAANTDLQALEELDLNEKIQLGAELTRGLGAGANPEIGRRSAIESCEMIAKTLHNADMVFITAGMGGGTGTGAAGVIANIAKKQGALTVGVVTRPFFFEGRRRAKHAEAGIQFLKEQVDTLIVIPNQKLLKTVDENTSLLSAFKSVDNILLQAVKGISDLVNEHGLINLDFSDIKTIMSEKGLAIIGTGSAKGDNRAEAAARMAVSSPLLEDSSFKGAMGVIINITGGADLSLVEVNQTAQMITDQAHPDAEIIFGAVVDPNESNGHVRVTVIATGFTGDGNQKERTHSSKGYDSASKGDINSRSTIGSNESTTSVSYSQSRVSNEHHLQTGGMDVLHSDKDVPHAIERSLSKDVLLEKACLPREHTSKGEQKNSIQQQLSMDITDKKERVSDQLPFEKNKKRTLLGLFK